MLRTRSLLLCSGLLYYAGHGYENYGNSFMVPVDAPIPYRSANCLCVQSILKLMQEKETGLNVFLLDMCRKRWLRSSAQSQLMSETPAGENLCHINAVFSGFICLFVCFVFQIQ